MGEVFYEKGKKYNCYKNGKPYFRKSATINGKRHDFYGDGEKDVQTKIEEAKKMTFVGFDYDERSSKVGKIFKYWLFNIKRIDINIKATTFARYEAIFRLHIAPYPISDLLLSKLNAATLQTYITGMYENDNKTTATIRNTVKLWRMFCTWAQEEGYLVRNPASKVAIPGKRVLKEEKVEVFSEYERKKILDYMDTHNYEYDTLIKLAFATGMRQGELLALRWADIYDGVIHIKRSTAIVSHIDMDGNTTREREVWDTKTINAVRNIPILPQVQTMLNQHKIKQRKYFDVNGGVIPTYVFTNMNGKLVDASNLRKSFERLLASAGVPYRRFHCIRHTFATEALRRGVDVKDVQKLMGHSNISTTYIYIQSDDDSRRKAMEQIGGII